MDKLNNRIKFRLYISLILILILPEGLILNFGFQSASVGALAGWIIAILLLYFDYGTPVKFNRLFIRVIFATFFLIVLSLVIGVFVNNNFDFGRFLLSLFLIIIELVAVFIFSFRLSRIDDPELDSFMKNIAIALLAFSFIVQTKWFLFSQPAKMMIFFTEPSHFAITASPFFIYYIVASKAKKAFLFSLIIFISALFIENLTLTIPILISVFILNKKYLIAFLGLTIVALPLIGPAFSTYIAIRTSALIDPENQNLSALVYLQGWEYVISSIKNFNGIGIGFQQLGQLRLQSSSQDLLEFMGYTFNQNDGAFLFSKIFVEFGWIALIFITIYIGNMFYVYKKIAKLKFKKNSWSLFISTTYLSFLIPLFIRNSSYFNPGIFLFLIALIGFSFPENKNLS